MPRIWNLNDGVRVLVDVQLADRHLAGVFGRQRVDRRRQPLARAAPLRPEIHQHRRRRFSTSSSKLPSVKVCTFSAAIVSPSVLAPSALGPSLVAQIARSYILTYSRAERSHEKSCRIPASCSARHVALVWRTAVSARASGAEQRRAAMYSWNDEPGRRVSPARSRTVSASPPTALHDRHRAVAQAVHLIQPARLEARRHQEDVGAAFDRVRQRLVESDVRADAIGVAARRAPPHVLIARLARCRARRTTHRAAAARSDTAAIRSKPF